VYGPKQDYAGALAYVDREKLPGDVIATGGLATIPYIDFYQTGWTVVQDASQLEALRASANRTWFVYTFPEVLRAQSASLSDLVARDFHPQKTFYGTVGDGAVFVTRYDASVASR
jgi:hypothetical protein